MQTRRNFRFFTKSKLNLVIHVPRPPIKPQHHHHLFISPHLALRLTSYLSDSTLFTTFPGTHPRRHLPRPLLTAKSQGASTGARGSTMHYLLHAHTHTHKPSVEPQRAGAASQVLLQLHKYFFTGSTHAHLQLATVGSSVCLCACTCTEVGGFYCMCVGVKVCSEGAAIAGVQTHRGGGDFSLSIESGVIGSMTDAVAAGMLYVTLTAFSAFSLFLYLSVTLSSLHRFTLPVIASSSSSVHVPLLNSISFFSQPNFLSASLETQTAQTLHPRPHLL